MSETGIVAFDYSVWGPQFPALAASVSGPQAAIYFGMAGLYLQNDCFSQLTDLPKRGLILNLLTAHLVTLFVGLNGNPPNPLVGRISNAAEGSVSVAVDFPQNPNAAWFNQTPYGATAWVAMAPYRVAMYMVPPQVPLAAQSYPGAGVFGGGPPFNGGFPWPR